MRKLSLYFLPFGSFLAVCGLVGPTANGKSFAELSDYLEDCRKNGSLTTGTETQIVDFEKLSDGKTDAKMCVYDTVCNNVAKNIRDYHHVAVCAFDETTGCEPLIECIPNIKKRKGYGFVKAVKQTVADRCTDALGNQFIYGEHLDNKDNYTAVCIQEITCSNPKEYVPLVMCSTTGMEPVPGKNYQRAICPSPSECKKKPMKFETSKEYVAKMEAAKVAQAAKERANIVSSTLPRGSDGGVVSTSDSKPNHPGKK